MLVNTAPYLQAWCSLKMPKPQIEFTPVFSFNTFRTNAILTTTSLSHDPNTGDQSAILMHTPGSSWSQPVCDHIYWKECYVLEGRSFDESLGRWFDAGHYCCRPSGMKHGPYKADPERGCKEICYVRYEKR